MTSDDTRYQLEHQLLGRFTVIDADTASVVVRSPPVVVEGQPAVEMCFALSARVTAAVAILVENGVAVNDTVDYSEIAFVSGLSVNGSDSISLNETTWQTGDCVMVYAPEDDVAEGARTFTVRYELSSVDGNYDGQSDLVVVSVDDNDYTGIELHHLGRSAAFPLCRCHRVRVRTLQYRLPHLILLWSALEVSRSRWTGCSGTRLGVCTQRLERYQAVAGSLTGFLTVAH